LTILFTSLQASYGDAAYNVVSRTRDHQDTTFYSEGLILCERSGMSATVGRTRELGTATLGGLVVGSVVSAILAIGAPFYPDIFAFFYPVMGAFIGGVVAAYLVHGKSGQAVRAGVLSGVLGTPFFFGLTDIFAYLGLIPIPSGQIPTLAELQTFVVFIVGMNLVGGAVGGAVLGAVYHPPGQLPPTLTPESATGTGPGQKRYCVQCGAQLAEGVLICPHCGARQAQ
jgi:hypothetical protein